MAPRISRDSCRQSIRLQRNRASVEQSARFWGRGGIGRGLLVGGTLEQPADRDGNSQNQDRQQQQLDEGMWQNVAGQFGLRRVVTDFAFDLALFIAPPAKRLQDGRDSQIALDPLLLLRYAKRSSH